MTMTQRGSLKRDDNEHPMMGGTSSTDNDTIINASFDPSTRRLLVDMTGTLTSAGTVYPSTYAVDEAAMPATPSVIPVGAEYRAAATTYTDGDATVLQSDINGNLKETLATLMAGEDLTADVLKTEQRFSYAYIAAGQATTTIKSGSGFLHRIIFWAPATATNVTTIYDNTAGSGSIIGLPLATAVVNPLSVEINATFATGLTVVTATANGAPMTFIYR